MRALEPLGGCLDPPRWHAVLLCLLAMMDQVGAGWPWCCYEPYKRTSWAQCLLSERPSSALMVAQLCSGG